MWPFKKTKLNDNISLTLNVGNGEAVGNFDSVFLNKFLTSNQIKFLNGFSEVSPMVYKEFKKYVPVANNETYSVGGAFTEEDAKKIIENNSFARKTYLTDEQRTELESLLKNIETEEEEISKVINEIGGKNGLTPERLALVEEFTKQFADFAKQSAKNGKE